MATDPVTIVDAQIRAYEAGDADRFAALHAPDATCVSLPSGKVIAANREEIRSVWGALFARSARRVTIKQRIVDGRYVVDLEQVTIADTGACLQVTAIYLVGRDWIERVWFLERPAEPVATPPV